MKRMWGFAAATGLARAIMAASAIVVILLPCGRRCYVQWWPEWVRVPTAPGGRAVRESRAVTS